MACGHDVEKLQTMRWLSCKMQVVSRRLQVLIVGVRELAFNCLCH
jgi:hypothetical protein